MAQEDPRNYRYEKDDADLAELKSGKDSGNTLDQQQVGELAYGEIGADGFGSLAGYDLVALGGIPEPHRRNDVGKVSGDLQEDTDGDGTVEDVPAGTQLRVRLTDYTHTETIAETKWFKVGDIEQSDPAKRPTMEFDGVNDANWAKTGRHIVVEVRNKRNSLPVDYSNSTLEFPIIGARESVNA